MRRAMWVVGLLVVTPAMAQETQPDQEIIQAKVAQTVVLAKTAAIICPTLAADEEHIHALLDQTGLSEKDLMPPGRFAAQDEDIARSFARSVAADPVQACGDLERYLGDSGAKLVRRNVR